MLLILGIDRVVLIMTSQNKSSMQMKSLAQPTIDNRITISYRSNADRNPRQDLEHIRSSHP
jgi:hypothetical protein